MQIAENEIRGKCNGAKCVIEVSAQVRVSEFYKKLGFTQLGTIPNGFLMKDGTL